MSHEWAVFCDSREYIGCGFVYANDWKGVDCDDDDDDDEDDDDYEEGEDEMYEQKELCGIVILFFKSMLW